MGGVKVLGVDPTTLKQAADGINGVISGISGGAFGSYRVNSAGGSTSCR